LVGCAVTGESEFLPPGITEAELLATCVGPDLEKYSAAEGARSPRK
jgi:hypothetical protein